MRAVGLLVALAMLLASPAGAQVPDTVEVREVVDQMPVLVGGIGQLERRVMAPEGVAGRVVLQIVVGETGGMVEATCARSSDNRLCAPAIEALEASVFEPGRHGGQPVAVRTFLSLDVVPLSARQATPRTLSRSARPPRPVVTPDTSEVYTVVEKEPELIGGIEGLQRRVVYPETARRSGFEGTVYVQFIVDETGSVTDPECVRLAHHLLCEAAIRAINTARFTPGTQEGRPVRVRFTVPIRFKLTD